MIEILEKIEKDDDGKLNVKEGSSLFFFGYIESGKRKINKSLDGFYVGEPYKIQKIDKKNRKVKLIPLEKCRSYKEICQQFRMVSYEKKQWLFKEVLEDGCYYVVLINHRHNLSGGHWAIVRFSSCSNTFLVPGSDEVYRLGREIRKIKLEIKTDSTGGIELRELFQRNISTNELLPSSLRKLKIGHG